MTPSSAANRSPAIYIYCHGPAPILYVQDTILNPPHSYRSYYHTSGYPFRVTHHTTHTMLASSTEPIPTWTQLFCHTHHWFLVGLPLVSGRYGQSTVGCGVASDWDLDQQQAESPSHMVATEKANKVDAAVENILELSSCFQKVPNLPKSCTLRANHDRNRNVFTVTTNREFSCGWYTLFPRVQTKGIALDQPLW